MFKKVLKFLPQRVLMAACLICIWAVDTDALSQNETVSWSSESAKEMEIKLTPCAEFGVCSEQKMLNNFGSELHPILATLILYQAQHTVALKPGAVYRRLQTLHPKWRRLAIFQSLESESLWRLGLSKKTAYLDNYFEKIGVQKAWAAMIRFFSRVHAIKNLKRLLDEQISFPAPFNHLLSVDMTEQELRSSIEKQFREGRPKEALTTLETYTEKFEDRCFWWYSKVKALRNLRRWRQASMLLERGLKSCPPENESYPWFLLLGSRIHENRGHNNQAIKWLGDLVSRNQTHRLRDDGVYHLVRVQLKKGINASTMLETLKLFGPNYVGDRVDDTIFAIALSFFNTGRWDDAQKLLRERCSTPSWRADAGEEGRCLYWRARALENMAKSSEGLYTQIIGRHPWSWYSWLSSKRLGWHVTDVVRYHRLVEERQASELRTAKRNISELRREEENEKIREFLFRAGDWLTEFESTPSDPCQMLNTHQCLKLIKHTHPLSSIDRVSDRHARLRKLFFPMKYREVIHDEALKNEVPEALIFSVIHEESAFNEKARSFVGAQGLMQLMPATAKSLRRQLSMPTTRLELPKSNIALGTAYLRMVKNYCQCSWTLVAPGYNAGQGALKKWLRKRPSEPLDLFVENIPYEEAKRYTKLVNRSFVTYRSLIER